MTGVDVPVPEIEAAIHQPTIIEISYIGELAYFSAIQTICFNRNTILAGASQGTGDLQKLNNFQIFMTLITDTGIQGQQKRLDDLQQCFTLLLPQYKMSIMPRGIFFNDVNTKKNFTLDERNFDAVREVIHKIGGLDNVTGGQNASFNPKGEKAAKIAAKIMAGRVKAAKSKGEKMSGNSGVLMRYVSILTVGVESMSLDKCINLTVYQLYDLIERYGLYVGWDLDIKSRLAGGKPNDKPDDWMKDIH